MFYKLNYYFYHVSWTKCAVIIAYKCYLNALGMYYQLKTFPKTNIAIFLSIGITVILVNLKFCH